ncbi:MAG TPA: hypothetical protein VEW74_05030 [Candidatus Nitrosotalea sp.]|nr:hypothetical protein [Candidatus Nitrosotalea sp.]
MTKATTANRRLRSIRAAATAATALFIGALSLPLPAAAGTFSDHFYASLAALMSAAVGADASTPVLSEAEAASNFEVTAGWRNLYPSGGTFVTALAARRGGLFPEQGGLSGGGLGSVFVPGDESRERYQLIQEFDDPKTGVERFEAAIGTSLWHGTTPYRTHYVSVDYYAGSVSRFGYDGHARRFDLYTSYLQTNFGHLLEVSPTYSLPIDTRGRTTAWASLTIDAPLGNTVERYAGIAAGLTRQASRRVNLAFSATRYWARDENGAFSRRFEISAGARLKF